MNIKDILDKLKNLAEPPKSTSGFAYVFWVPNYDKDDNKYGDFKAAPAELLLGPKASLLLQATALSEGAFIFGPFPANNKEEAIRAFGAWVQECEARGVSVFDQDKYVPRIILNKEVATSIAMGSIKAREILGKTDKDPNIRKDLIERIRRYDTKRGEPCSNCGEIHNDGDDGPNVEIRVIALPMGASGGGLSMLPSIQDNETKDFGPN